MTDEVERPWKPFTPQQVADLFADLPCRWWLAGGWALDRHVGRQTREHQDIDIVVLREDHQKVQRHLAGWTLMAADPPGSLRPWAEGEHLASGVRDVWCRPSGGDSWSLQLMIVDPDGDQWIYRRDPRVRRPLDSISGPASTSHLPLLAPEIQLLYKSHRPRPKDHQDFEAAVAHLEAAQRSWLRSALLTVDPVHTWLARL